MNMTSGFFRNLAIIPAILAGLSLTHNAYSEKSSGGGPQRARPEPMVFDLIDPLGAPKGEFEINALLDYSARTGQIEWSPEIEYSFADGYAVELELPLENTSVDEYKLSFQGTFGELAEGRMIHGWQAIGRGKRQEKAFGAEALYLNGYQFSDRWSMMNMLGIRQTAIARSGDLIGLMNNSVFYSYSERIVLGVELNNEIGERCWRYRLTPQAQYTFGKNKTLKLGGGPSQLNEEQKTDWMLTSRLAYNF